MLILLYTILFEYFHHCLILSLPSLLGHSDSYFLFANLLPTTMGVEEGLRSLTASAIVMLVDGA